MSDPYIKGFNEGYVIAAHLPDIAKDVSKVNGSSPWLEGFRDGREQYIDEKMKVWHPAWLDVGQDKGWSMGRWLDQPQDRDREDDREIER